MQVECIFRIHSGARGRLDSSTQRDPQRHRQAFQWICTSQVYAASNGWRGATPGMLGSTDGLPLDPLRLCVLHETWVAAGHGLRLDEVVVTHTAWADDPRVFDACEDGLHTMLAGLSQHAWKTTGQAIRWEKCAYAQATGDPHGPPTPESVPMLAEMRHHGQGECPQRLAQQCTDWPTAVRRVGGHQAEMLGSLPHAPICAYAVMLRRSCACFT